MSDPNKELIGRLARRGEVVETPPPPPAYVADWNAPIDTIQADCLSLRAVVNGEFAAAKSRAREWIPGPMPRDWWPA